jgi:hypothetical protein
LALSVAQQPIRGQLKTVLVVLLLFFTGKSVSEALILESVNPKYDNRLFIDLQLLTQKNTNSEHVVYKNCFERQNKNKKQFLYTTCSELVFFWARSHKSMNNWLSYCGLTQGQLQIWTEHSHTDL